MYFDINLGPEPPVVSLQDLDNFRMFQIEASGPRERIGEAIAPYGRWDGEFAWFDPDKVTEAAGARAAEPSWQEGFRSMCDYGAQHGYIGEDGSIRAHVEWRE